MKLSTAYSKVYYNSYCKLKKSIIFSLTILIVSCSHVENLNNDRNVVNIPITNLEECNITPYSQLFDSIKLITLETNKECLLGRIDEIFYINNSILILDKIIAKSVFMFNENGKFVQKVGKIGKGPGEYMSPADMTVNRSTKEILIYDNAKATIIVYGFDGKFHREFRLENRIEAFSVVNENEYALYFNSNKDEEIDVLPKHNLHIVDEKMNVLFKGFDRTASFIPSLEGTNSFSSSQGDLLFHPSFDNKIYKVSSSSVTTEYYVDFGELNLEKAFIENLTSDENSLEHEINAIDNAGKTYIRDFFQTDNYIILNVIHNHLVKNVFYSKKTGKVKVADILFNDMYGLIPGMNDFSGFEGDIAISYFIPHQVHLSYYKTLLSGSINDDKLISNKLLNSLKQASMQEDCFNKMDKMLDTLTYSASERENSEIMQLNIDSNPVVFAHKIKAF